MKFDIETIIKEAQTNTKEFVHALSQSYVHKKVFEDIVNMATLEGELFDKINFEDLNNLYSYSYDVWLKVENVSIVDVMDCVAFLLNEKRASIDKIINTPRREFGYVVLDKNYDLYKTHK
ncbi:MAG: hypothetical protein R3Y32_06945 [Bacillota bacterium]